MKLVVLLSGEDSGLVVNGGPQVIFIYFTLGDSTSWMGLTHPKRFEKETTNHRNRGICYRRSGRLQHLLRGRGAQPLLAPSWSLLESRRVPDSLGFLGCMVNPGRLPSLAL